jgi:plasmid stability protein
MTITVDITPEVKDALARQAAAHGRGVEAYAASLLEEAVQPGAAHPGPPELEGKAVRLGRRPPGRKSLAQLFAESPFKGLDLDFERDQDLGRDVDL